MPSNFFASEQSWLLPEAGPTSAIPCAKLARVMLAFRCLVPAILLVASVGAAAQTSTPQPPESIKDPKELLAAIRPYYDFDNPALKPWHLKATYQIFDPDGNPGEQGTFEYWWASPTVNRRTWTRGTNTRSEWHTADGKKFETDNGKVLHLFELDFLQHLLNPLPNPDDIDGKGTSLDRYVVTAGKARFPCVRSIDQVKVQKQDSSLPYPGTQVTASWCFDPKLPLVLLVSRSGSVNETFADFVNFQDRHLPKSFLERVDQRRLLSATIDQIDTITADDPALTPPSTALGESLSALVISSKKMADRRISSPAPEYPAAAKNAGLAGSVALEATIGKDGKIENLEVVSTPGKLLTDAATAAVSKWTYTPYLFNGSPIEARTSIFVSYRLN
jgi:TonB family protein